MTTQLRIEPIQSAHLIKPKEITVDEEDEVVDKINDVVYSIATLINLIRRNSISEKELITRIHRLLKNIIRLNLQDNTTIKDFLSQLSRVAENYGFRLGNLLMGLELFYVNRHYT